jgi:hypothetical protein
MAQATYTSVFEWLELPLWQFYNFFDSADELFKEQERQVRT